MPQLTISDVHTIDDYFKNLDELLNTTPEKIFRNVDTTNSNNRKLVTQVQMIAQAHHKVRQIRQVHKRKQIRVQQMNQQLFKQSSRGGHSLLFQQFMRRANMSNKW